MTTFWYLELIMVIMWEKFESLSCIYWNKKVNSVWKMLTGTYLKRFFILNLNPG
jgi:hypothetical protein